MGIFNWEKKKKFNLMRLLNGQLAVTYGGDIEVFLNDVVNACIMSNANEMSKLLIKHVKRKDGLQVPLNSKLQVALNEPSEFMTQSDFIMRMVYQYYKKGNCFVYPMYKVVADEENPGALKKDIEEFFVIDYERAEIGKDANGTPAIKFVFMDGTEIILKYNDVIHWKRNPGAHPVFGGDRDGKSDYSSIQQVVEVSDYVMKSIINGVSVAYNKAGIIKYNTVTDEKNMAKKIKEFETRLKNNDSAIMGIDLKYDYTPLTNNLSLVDKDLLAFIDEKICRLMDNSVAMLSGDFTPAQHYAHFQKDIEPKINALNQCFTKALFTRNQKTRGHEVNFFYYKTAFMTIDQINELVKNAGDRGALTDNTILELYGLPPYEGGNVRKQSLNYINASIADAYQLGKKGGVNNAE